MATGEDPLSNFVDINRRLWNDTVDYNAASPLYDVDGFLRGKDTLNSIEVGLLGNLCEQRILHLQCHFGLDSLSLARRGAQHVVGVDLADRAILKAQELALAVGLNTSTRFICCNVYDLDQHLSCHDDDLFDIVFTSYGAIGWLPDINRWAKLVSTYLKPGGIFVMAEFHPVARMFDDTFSRIENSYFNRAPIVSDCEGTYADRAAPISNSSIEWNHSLSEVLQALIQHGLCINIVQEFDYEPFDCFQNNVKAEEGVYRIKGLEKKIPLTYAVKATKLS